MRRKNRAGRTGREMRFESLEARKLLAADVAADVSNGLVIEGTEDADRISAFVDDCNQLHVIVNGNERIYDSDSVDGLHVRAKGGDDHVRIDESVFQWTTINGGSGDDKIDGGSGNDRIDAGSGNDVVRGGYGNDVIQGGWGNDFLSGNAGDDVITGDPLDILPGTPSSVLHRGNDKIDGGSGNDSIRGMVGNDTINGGSGDD
ncbi:MAG: hypothetical protein MK171_12795, partial [Pirellulales bacterium]|nr:hypothetical protein [Pirellulales bacterium]